jgi:hypothetical protein
MRPFDKTTPEDPVAQTPTPRPLDAAARAGLKQWVDTWKRAGPLLEEERWVRLRSMTTADAQAATWRLLEMWQPDWVGDDGEEILLHQRVFARARS